MPCEASAWNGLNSVNLASKLIFLPENFVSSLVRTKLQVDRQSSGESNLDFLTYRLSSLEFSA